jgi:hypothetical protein
MSIRAVRGAVVVTLVASGTVVGPESPVAAAGSAGFCPDASGVTIVVDFNELGGGTVVRCAHGDQATGLAALKNAGFQVTGTLRWGEGFVCRIDGRPSAAMEKCVDTPPASAYWSYWHAPNGGSWTYSDMGALHRKPPAGSFEGWSFSLNRGANDAPRPRIAPKRPAPAPVSSPPPAPPTPSRPSTGDDPVTPPSSGNVAPPPVARGRPGESGQPGRAFDQPTPASLSPAATDPGVPADVTPSATSGPAPTGSSGQAPVTEVAASRGDGGPPLGTMAGVLLLAVLVGGGVAAARRRRRAADPDG